MEVWRFTTDAYLQSEQRQAWHNAMKRLCMPVGNIPTDRHFRGSACCQVSPLGMEFSLIDATALELTAEYMEQSAAIWLLLLLEGQAQLLLNDGHCIELDAGDIAYGPGPCRSQATMRFPANFRVLHIRIPRLILSPRVIAPLPIKVGHLYASSGIDHIFAGMLKALSETMENLAPDELQPVELAIKEFLIASLGGEKTIFGLGGAAGARASHLHRICQSIETMLSDPALNLTYVAREHGISTRYLQKLFTGAGMSFSQYLRSRRLERCRADLTSPQHSELSISDVCFRWGFNGSAYFSRAFKNEYGISPREYRQGKSISPPSDRLT